ncbi:MAG TPA: hypothetical protein VMM55_01330 [Thermohalobaculum sp.]|nr:hypothetical protein [Thermohalobaculum sp.]
MVVPYRALRAYLVADDGAVTIDWVALTAGILLLGIVVILSIFSNGVAPLTGSINDKLSGANAGLCSELESGLGLDVGDCDVLLGD